MYHQLPKFLIFFSFSGSPLPVPEGFPMFIIGGVLLTLLVISVCVNVCFLKKYCQKEEINTQNGEDETSNHQTSPVNLDQIQYSSAGYALIDENLMSQDHFDPSVAPSSEMFRMSNMLTHVQLQGTPPLSSNIQTQKQLQGTSTLPSNIQTQVQLQGIPDRHRLVELSFPSRTISSSPKTEKLMQSQLIIEGKNIKSDDVTKLTEHNYPLAYRYKDTTLTSDIERDTMSSSESDGFEVKTGKENMSGNITNSLYLNPYVPLNINDMEYMHSYSGVTVTKRQDRQDKNIDSTVTPRNDSKRASCTEHNV